MSATLVIMAAGMGSRYGGNKQIDGMGPNGEILMEYSVYDAIEAGFTKVILRFRYLIVLLHYSFIFSFFGTALVTNALVIFVFGFCIFIKLVLLFKFF